MEAKRKKNFLLKEGQQYKKNDAYANQRRKSNAIKFIFDNQKKLESKAEEIAKVLSTHFEDIYTSSNPSQEDINDFLQYVEP